MQADLNWDNRSLERKGKSFNMIKMQLEPAGKSSLSVAKGVHGEKYPHPLDGHYHLH